MSKQLKKEVREHLATILEMKPKVITVRLSEIKRDYPQLTPAAAAQELAKRKGKSIMRFLNDDDKKALASMSPATAFSPIIVRTTTHKNGGEKRVILKPILVFPSADPFIERHITEINGTYHTNCCTATFILCRKVMENLIVQVLRKKFSTIKNRTLYEDAASRRSLDFSVVLDNFYKARSKFSISASSAIERIKQKATPFKNDANDKAHSLFHIASKKEMEDANVQEIFDLITVVMKEVGL